ncbi:hypothetical protein [Rubritalea marina]|uniref:hypothetical protein n=1 Tax=Rubritalea marina TaxID=361055 RepID=UPI0003657414|nr:hypothetical protein [Rubritalea marina]
MNEAWDVQLTARQHWNSVSWFKPMKWPSGHQVDLGDALLEFDFDACRVTEISDGVEREVARFPDQKRGTHLGSLAGAFRCGEFIVERHASDEGDPLKVTVKAAGGNDSVELMMRKVHQPVLCEGAFELNFLNDNKDSRVEIKSSNEARDVAVLVASLLLFNRFALA